jgi:transposase
MNMPNKFVSNLTEEDVTKLEQLWQTNANFRVRNRAQSILLSYRRVGIDELARICGVGRDAVSSWINKWETSGEAGLKDKVRSGRRPTLSRTEETEALKIALEVPQSPARQLAEIEKKVGKRISGGILKRLLKKNIVGNQSSAAKLKNTIGRNLSELKTS